MKTKSILSALILSVLSFNAFAQLLLKDQIKFNLNEDGSHYIKTTFVNQTWVRYTEANPGTTVFGTPQNEIFDIGLRRTRVQFFGQLTDKVFFYSQFGQNNFNYLSKLQVGSFFHDVVGEYKVAGKHLSIGAGLTGWSGLSRYASPSIATTLGVDAPLYQQATNGVNDQFLRKLSIYAKGKLGKVDYRVALSKPMAIQNAINVPGAISKSSDFSSLPPQLQSQGYFMYQFLDQEDNIIPYTAGTYKGGKKVFNIGAGFIYQPNAMWHTGTLGDTISTPMQLFAADLFYDAPINAERGDAITVYACYSYSGFGPNYVRNLGVMNPANGVNASGTFNGAGNAVPLIGTGNTYFAQVGYLLPKSVLPDGNKLQVYASSQYSKFEKLKDPMLMLEVGLNWYLGGNNKISLGYQSRPVFTTQTNGDITNTSRKGMYVLQYQIAL